MGALFWYNIASPVSPSNISKSKNNRKQGTERHKSTGWPLGNLFRADGYCWNCICYFATNIALCLKTFLWHAMFEDFSSPRVHRHTGIQGSKI